MDHATQVVHWGSRDLVLVWITRSARSTTPALLSVLGDILQRVERGGPPMTQLRSHGKKPTNVQAGQTVEVRARMRALQWISDEFPDEYKVLLAQGAPGPKKILAERHRDRFLELWRDEIRWVLKDDE